MACALGVVNYYWRPGVAPRSVPATSTGCKDPNVIEITDCCVGVLKLKATYEVSFPLLLLAPSCDFVACLRTTVQPGLVVTTLFLS